MIAFIVALLLAVLGHGPMPAVEAPALSAAHAVQTPAPRAVAPTPSHGRASAGGASTGVPVQRPASSATVAAPPVVAQPSDTQRMSDNPCDVGETYNPTTDLCDPS